MNEQPDIDKAVREMVTHVLASRSSALSESGLRATVEVKHWLTEGRVNCGLRMGFWREHKFIDGLEALIVRDGNSVNSLKEFTQWVEEKWTIILERNREAPGAG